ncbi:MAG: trypsin-like peptidase domain-containing protein, partial [Bacillota bacterium]|nr:trypsin-like peptidase domain-containing protein [Bacillota bacterium]
EDFPYLETGDSAALKQGQQVYAIGSPLGLDNTMSQGIISNAKRAVSGTEYIQISVPIAMGSSGGALLDEQGRVIGVTTAGFMNSPGDLNLAIPIHCVNGLDRRATAEKVSYMDSYYSGYTQALDFGAFSGAELVGSEKRGLGYILQYDAMDFHDVFETEAASCFANTLYYYRMALEEQGLKQQGAADITGVFASDTERVEVIADLEDTMSVFVIIQKEPQMYEKSPNLIDLGWYMGLETENPAEMLGGRKTVICEFLGTGM